MTHVQHILQSELPSKSGVGPVDSQESEPTESLQKHYGRLVSDSLPVSGIAWDQFLSQARGLPRFYWESSRDGITFAGSGSAVELAAWGANRFDNIQAQAAELFEDAIHFNADEPLSAPRLFGGFAFREDFVPDNTWWDFTPAHFVLPHYQLLNVRGETWLTININLPMSEDPQDVRSDLRRALVAKIYELQTHDVSTAHPQPVHVNYPMPYEVWHNNIMAATQRMKQNELKKVVLSRVAEVRFDRRVDVLAALQQLAAAYPDTYRFLFEPRPYHAFYGATPELLVKVENNVIETMALAGSIRRGDTLQADEEYAQQLLSSEKDRYEHQVVADEISRRLSPLTEQLHVGEPGILRLSNIQHIYTPIKGTLKDGEGVLPIVNVLHPTPALGGDPREIAMAMIQEMEPVPRGWYGAPIGWIDQHMNGQFGVGIRSAVAQDQRVWMYAGAGIVAASDPQKEWDETALKFKPMLNALHIQDTNAFR